MNLNKIVEEWVGEVDMPYFEPEDPKELGRLQGRNNHIVYLKQRIPQLTERIVEEIKQKLYYKITLYPTNYNGETFMLPLGWTDELAKSVIKSLTE